ncbi:ATP-dependent helicase HrpB [Pendulispora albinea]|uniref:ATP-dependent helicase HrpB n=1 Tax=Pendulispora albinea TaxID=2741071 RepID=A0ABZ2LR25_9BACT
MHPLPIDPLLPEIVRRLERAPNLVLEAPPGAGKTTRVPRALLEHGAAKEANGEGARGEIIVLEPRRLAARLSARRVAEEIGEAPGETVGYQVRFEDVTGPKTRLRFVTEAILTRRLLGDPQLKGVHAVVLDEFHERHIHGDVALACLRHLQRTSRPDLRIVVMSATLDAEPAARFLGCDSLRSEGRRFDVRIEHATKEDERPLELQVASAVRTVMSLPEPGDVLVFLPGAREIRRAQEALEKLAAERDLLVLPLHGDLSPAEQDRAIRPAERHKVILATNVAESSVTIDGVVAVVDSGLARVMGHDPWSGLPRLRVEKVSRASATQRAGRAGRTRPGVCVRLYTKMDFERRPEHQPPEIARLDLTELLLELRAQKIDRALEWLDPPPPVSLAAAEELLVRLGALETEASSAGEVTAIGRRMLRYPLHPRIGRLLVEAEDRGVFDDATVLAALLAERDIRASARAQFGGGRGGRPGDVATEDSDLLQMRDLFREAQDARFTPHVLRAIGLDAGPTFAVDRAHKQLRRIGRLRDRDRGDDTELRKCLLTGYPDRVARRVRGRTLAMAGGGRAELAESSAVRDAPWLLALDGDESRRDVGTIRIASAIEPEWLIEFYADRIVESTRTTFVRTSQRVESISSMTYDGLVLDESPAAGTARADDAEAAALLAEAVLADGIAGLAAFAPEGALEEWVLRARFARTVDPSIPLVDDAFLRAVFLEHCMGRRSFAELREASFLDAVQARLGSVFTARIFALAPERITLARGRSVKIRYEAEKTPHIASRLQDFFGMKETPKVGGGKVPLVVHLLAPNQRAVQVTSDLEGFWERHYPALRKQLSRRYPKHAWPERPES